MSAHRPTAWAGIDVGKTHHWVCLIDPHGETVFSAKVDNDETAILDAIGAVLERAETVLWGVDITGTTAGLLLGLLAAHDQHVLYVPGRTVNRMSGAYRGEAKTDARDAYVIAETIRHRTDLSAVTVPAELVAQLRLLVTYRSDRIADRVRLLNRLRDTLTGYFPALERAFDYATQKGPLVLLTGYQTPAGIRRIGDTRLSAWLAKRNVRAAQTVAATAVRAARAQHTTVPGEEVAAAIIARLARAILNLDDEVRELDTQIRTTFAQHPQAAIIESMPGIGAILGAELIVAVGDFGAYRNAGHLASAAGLVPVPRDSGRRTGNLHRPKRYSRHLRRVFYLSAQSSMMRPGINRDYYLKKRAEGCKHVQAIIALARRRVDVLWALLRDQRLFEPAAPQAQAA